MTSLTHLVLGEYVANRFVATNFRIRIVVRMSLLTKYHLICSMLDSNSLFGTIPSEIKFLTSLTNFYACKCFSDGRESRIYIFL